MKLNRERKIIALLFTLMLTLFSTVLAIQASISASGQELLIGLSAIPQYSASSAPVTEWNKTYGGADDDRAYDVEPTVDGAYVVAGYTESFGAGLGDFWLIRLSAVGIHEHDVAVVGIKTSKTIVGQGLSLNLDVTVQNQGNHTETFNVTTYYNETNLISKQTIALASGNYATLTSTWNTTDITMGVYALSAEASQVQNETEAIDNTFVDGIVKVTIRGDVNDDGIVDIFDIVVWADAFNSQPGWPNWNPYADLNQDGIIDIFDAVIIAINYGITIT